MRSTIHQNTNSRKFRDVKDDNRRIAGDLSELIHAAIPASNLSIAALRPDEAAQIIGVSPKTLANWRCRGTGPQFIKLGGVRGSKAAVRYDRDALLSWLHKHTQDSEAKN
jgi:hypothetical protein